MLKICLKLVTWLFGHFKLQKYDLAMLLSSLVLMKILYTSVSRTGKIGFGIKNGIVASFSSLKKKELVQCLTMRVTKSQAGCACLIKL